MLKLQGAIKYGEEDLPAAKSLVDQGEQDDPDTEINRGEQFLKIAKVKKHGVVYLAYLTRLHRKAVRI